MEWINKILGTMPLEALNVQISKVLLSQIFDVGIWTHHTLFYTKYVLSTAAKKVSYENSYGNGTIYLTQSIQVPQTTI